MVVFFILTYEVVFSIVRFKDLCGFKPLLLLIMYSFQKLKVNLLIVFTLLDKNNLMLYYYNINIQYIIYKVLGMNLQETYYALIRVKEIMSEVNNIDLQLKYAGNPLYERIDVKKWEKNSAFAVAAFLLLYAVYSAFGRDIFSFIFMVTLGWAIVTIISELILIGVWIIVHFICWVIQNIRSKSPAIIYRKNWLLKQRNNLLANRDRIYKSLNQSVVPFAYRRLVIVQKLIEYIDNKRASDLKEAINLYETEQYRKKQLNYLRK